ncbi:MAG: DUF2798 domain-containing protein [Acinetobacter calcoaceticus]
MTVQRILLLLILSATMSFIISGISTFKVVGLNHHFLSLWVSAWIIAWLLAFPSVLICAPIAQKLVDIVFKKLEKVRL